MEKIMMKYYYHLKFIHRLIFSMLGLSTKYVNYVI